MGLRGESTARLGVRVGSWVSVSFSFRLTDDTPAPGQGLVVCCNGGWERACLVPWEKGGCDLPTRAQDATHQTPIVECDPVPDRPGTGVCPPDPPDRHTPTCLPALSFGCRPAPPVYTYRTLNSAAATAFNAPCSGAVATHEHAVVRIARSARDIEASAAWSRLRA